MNALARFANPTTILALALTLTVTGCKKQQPVDDTSLATAVQSKLSSDSALTSEPIQISVNDGAATLNGSVSNGAARSLAASDASQVPGIRTVVNNLTVTTTAAATPPPAMPVQPSAPMAPAPRPARAVPMPPPPAPRPAPQVVMQPPPPPAPVYKAPQPPPPPPPPAFRNVTLPAGTGLSIRITQTLDSASTQTGDAFTGVLASDVVSDGLIVVPHGTGVSGRVDDAKDATHYTGASHLVLSLISIDRRGERIPVTTDTVSKEGAARGKNTAEKVGGGAAVGAILGGIFGGGKGAAIGAAAGGGVGAGANTITKGQQVQIPSESVLRFQLANPVMVRVSTAQSDSSPDGLQRR